jgi:V-type H+-transporting ATPase subunit a
MLCAIPCIHICCGPKHHDVPDEFASVKAYNEEENIGLMGDKGGMADDMRDIEEMLKSGKAENHDSTGELFIHQIIETIEFVLGCISNTASYLRLWALSLAHGQLGEVFITIIFTQSGYDVVNGPSVVVTLYYFILGFLYMFAVMAVLLMMDALEVFLHTMRLHWVEFMGKFYEGAGIPFKPFSFTEVFEREQARKDAE